MPVFHGADPQAYLTGVVSAMRDEWQREWTPRFRAWQQMLEPTTAHHIARPGLMDTVLGTGEAKEKERSQIVSTWARAATTAILSRYLSADPVWRVITDDDPANETKAEHLAPYLDGIFMELDRRVVENRLGFSFDHLLKSSIVQFGKVIIRPGIVVEGDMARPIADIFSPEFFYHDIGKTYPCHYIYDRKLSFGRIRGELAGMGLELPEKWAERNPIKEEGKFTHVFIDDLADGKPILYEAVLIEDEPVLLGEGDQIERYRESPYYNHSPYIIVPMPPGPFSLSNAWGATGNHAEPIYAPGMRMVAQWEGLESVRADAAALAASPPVHIERAEGNEEKVRIAPGEEIETRRNEITITPIQTQTGGQFLAESTVKGFERALNSIIPSRLIEALSNPGDSALLNRDQLDQAEKALAPITIAVTTAKQMLAARLLEMMVDSNSPMQVRIVLDERAGAEREGRSRLVRLSKEMLPESYELNVEEPIEFPNDPLVQVQTYERLVASGAFSPIEARRKVFKDPRPRRSQELVDQAMVQKHPSSQARRVVQSLRDELAVAEVALKLAKTPETAMERRIAVYTILNDLAAQERALLGGQSPRQPPEMAGLAPAQQSQEQKGANSLTELRATGRAPVPMPAGGGG